MLLTNSESLAVDRDINLNDDNNSCALADQEQFPGKDRQKENEKKHKTVYCSSHSQSCERIVAPDSRKKNTDSCRRSRSPLSHRSRSPLRNHVKSSYSYRQSASPNRQRSWIAFGSTGSSSSRRFSPVDRNKSRKRGNADRQDTQRPRSPNFGSHNQLKKLRSNPRNCVEDSQPTRSKHSRSPLTTSPMLDLRMRLKPKEIKKESEGPTSKEDLHCLEVSSTVGPEETVLEARRKKFCNKADIDLNKKVSLKNIMKEKKHKKKEKRKKEKKPKSKEKKPNDESNTVSERIEKPQNNVRTEWDSSEDDTSARKKEGPSWSDDDVTEEGASWRMQHTGKNKLARKVLYEKGNNRIDLSQTSRIMSGENQHQRYGVPRTDPLFVRDRQNKKRDSSSCSSSSNVKHLVSSVVAVSSSQSRSKSSTNVSIKSRSPITSMSPLLDASRKRHKSNRVVIFGGADSTSEHRTGRKETGTVGQSISIKLTTGV